MGDQCKQERQLKTTFVAPRIVKTNNGWDLKEVFLSSTGFTFEISALKKKTIDRNETIS